MSFSFRKLNHRSKFFNNTKTKQTENITNPENEKNNENTNDNKETDNNSSIILNPKPDLTTILMNKKYEAGFNMVIIGDKKVGKTSIFNNIINYPQKLDNIFMSEYAIIEHNNIILMINDILTNNINNLIHNNNNNNNREPQIIIFIFDIDNIQTFMNIPEWHQKINSNNKSIYPIKYYLLANKRDLQPTRSLTGASKFAKDNDMTFIVTSIKQPETIDILREKIFEYIDNNKNINRTRKDIIRLGNIPIISNCYS